MATASTEAVGSEESMGGSTQVHDRENRRDVRQAEGAYTLAPKGKGSDTGAQAAPVADEAPPAERSDLTHAATETERGTPVVLPWGKASREASGEGCGYTRMEQAKAALS